MNNSTARKLVVTDGAPHTHTMPERVSLVNEQGERINLLSEAQLSSRYLAGTRVPSGSAQYPDTPNFVGGFTGNNIAADVGASVILWGGSNGQENIIGGAISQIGTHPLDNGGTPINGAGNNAPSLGTNTDLAFHLGGYNTILNGLAAFGGGFHNAIGVGCTHGTVLGGSWNHIDGNSDYAAMVGGTGNRIRNANWSGIFAGRGNSIEASQSFATGDANTIAAGADGSAAIGTQNTILAQGMAIGIDTIVEGVSATALGRRSRARTRGQLAIAADAPGGNGKEGQAQISFIPLTRQTTNATEAVAGTTVNGGNSHVLLAQQCVGYQFLVTAYEDATGDSKTWFITGAMKRRATGNNLHVGGAAPTPTVVVQDAGAAAWTCRVDISTNILVLRVTGEAGKTITWGAKVDLVEVGAF